MPRSFIPAGNVGVYTSLAAGRHGTLNVLCEGATGQYILVGTPSVIKFNPRTANLCSRCNGVCVHIQLPGDLDKKLIDTDSLRISETAVDDFSPKPVEIYPAPGAPRSVETDDRGVQVLKVKFIRYNRKGGSDEDEPLLIKVVWRARIRGNTR